MLSKPMATQDKQYLKDVQKIWKLAMEHQKYPKMQAIAKQVELLLPGEKYGEK